ncbi:hypothetical protein K435DRAFT_797975 [Dendrothele bispora CBS 962.96]|uniref:Uncharacterized protein n=1 Tax=Dendrothele bispora (strain CBS 962.96) TaxID=1314807 RepID=A0A4S8M1U5_DENBC|nr:hypothetical protein K435DRAFT_863568 [Dendrothele bispora CBS 962.96]THU95583.1 hypothetical protein K435DRAFT_797975 [Dendrothele bispora CBS 962.96]
MQNNGHGPTPPHRSTPRNTTGNNPPPHGRTDTRTQATQSNRFSSTDTPRGHATRQEYPLRFEDFSISRALVQRNQVAQPPPQNPNPNTRPQHVKREDHPLDWSQFSIAGALGQPPRPPSPPPSPPYRSFSPLYRSYTSSLMGPCCPGPNPTHGGWVKPETDDDRGVYGSKSTSSSNAAGPSRSSRTKRSDAKDKYAGRKIKKEEED